jgi:hypothetical protein
VNFPVPHPSLFLSLSFLSRRRPRGIRAPIPRYDFRPKKIEQEGRKIQKEKSGGCDEPSLHLPIFLTFLTFL